MFGKGKPEGPAGGNGELKEGVADVGMATAWHCGMCGCYIVCDELPRGYKCPLCGVGRNGFKRMEIAAEELRGHVVYL